MSSNSAMDVDGAPAPLKRSSSAPMINEASNSTMATPSSSSSATSTQTSFVGLSIFSQVKNRRHSESFSQVPGSPVSGSGLRRIHQLRQEEQESQRRELAHEKEIRNAMQISHSCEDLSLMNESRTTNNRIGPIHVDFQSPTRSRQVFLRRPESPVSPLRPSILSSSVKRKLDEKDVDFSVSPRSKRVYSCSGSENRGLLSTTSNSLPGSLSSAGTPESISSADSPGSGFTFRGVDSPSPTLQGSSHGEPMVVVVGKGGDHDMAESLS